MSRVKPFHEEPRQGEDGVLRALGPAVADSRETPFPEEAFPEVMATYGAALSETFRTPPGMFLLSMLAAVAGAAGKGWQLGGAVSGHKNWPNLFVLLRLVQ